MSDLILPIGLFLVPALFLYFFIQSCKEIPRGRVHLRKIKLLSPEQRATYNALEELETLTGNYGITEDYLDELPLY